MNLQFEALTPHLWVAQCRDLRMNTGILHDGRSAALIDPALLPGECGDIAAFCGEQGLTVESVVLTHHDWDHLLGAGFFPEAHIIAHRYYTDEVSVHHAQIQAAIRRYLTSAGGRPEVSFHAPTPTVTVDRILPLMVGGLRVLLVHAPGHARDHLVIYDAEAACLWAGDLLSDQEIPFISDSFSSYERTLAILSGMDIRLLVPGHGAVARSPQEVRARLDADHAYLTELRCLIGPVVAAHGVVQDAASACSGMLFRNPDANREAHAMNVEQAYLELGGSAPAGMVLGWAREL